MESQSTSVGASSTPTVSTKEFAAMNMVKSQTILARFCRDGSYFGVRPVKLANNRLAWPSVQVAR